MKNLTIGLQDIGDVVMLKSGGPRMVIKAIDGFSITCTWFYGEKLEENTFDLSQLFMPDYE